MGHRQAAASTGSATRGRPSPVGTAALLTESEPPASDPTLAELVEQTLAASSDPLLPAFAREVSALSDLARVHRALGVEQERRHRVLTEAVERERRGGRLGSEVGDAHTPSGVGGISTILPTWLRSSRRRCACAMSESGNVSTAGGLIEPESINPISQGNPIARPDVGAVYLVAAVEALRG